MTIRNLFASGWYTGKVIIWDDGKIGYIEYERCEDIEEMYLDSHILNWDILFREETIVITADITL